MSYEEVTKVKNQKYLWVGLDIVMLAKMKINRIVILIDFCLINEFV